MFDNLNDLHDDLGMRLLASGLRGGGGVQIYDNFLQASTTNYELDLYDTWLTLGRWNTLTRQYINGDSLEIWLDMIENKMKTKSSHGVAFMRTNTVKPRKIEQGPGHTTRRWGSCMIGFSFRRFPTPTLTMHSRSTYIGYIGRLDLGVASKLAGMIAERLGLEKDEIAFTWYLEQATLHPIRSLPWWFATPEAHAQLRDPKVTSFAATGSRKMLKKFIEQDKAGMIYGDESYRTYRNGRQKWHQAQKGLGFSAQFYGKGQYENITGPIKVKHTTLDELPFLTYNRGDGEAEAGYDDFTMNNENEEF